MPAWICVTCGVQHADTAQPPAESAICEDERQYVGPDGQRWTTTEELAADYAVVWREEEPDLIGVGMQPSFAIGQRALLVRTPSGNVLWDCTSLLDAAAQTAIAALGGIDAICMSHPHFYAANAEYADAFDARILIPTADRGVDSPALASDRTVRRGDRTRPGPDVGPHWWPFRRRGRVALAGRI